MPGYLLGKYGGWGSKTVVELFVRYAEKVFARYHPKVTRWFTFNEPIVVQTGSIWMLCAGPMEQNTSTWMRWNYRQRCWRPLSVVKRFRELGYPGTVGCILNPEVTYPRSRAPMTCARRRSTIYSTTACSSTRWCTASGRRSFALLEQHQVTWETSEEDLAVIREHTVDELGITLYYPHRVKAPSRAWHPHTPFHPAWYYEPFELPGRRMNASRGWGNLPANHL